MLGYGSESYGASPWGNEMATYDLSLATPTNSTSVDLVFTSDPEPTNPDISDPASYDIPELIIISASLVGSNVIRLITGSQVEGHPYPLMIIPVSFPDTSANELLVRNTVFIGVGASTVCVVNNLQAKTHCNGRRILLSWENPDGAARNKIVRRTKAWPFDLTEECDVVYDDHTPITSFNDIGPTLTDPEKTLEEQTYYYYVVLVSSVPYPTSYDSTDNSRTFALSISSLDSKNDFFWRTTPRVYKEKDALSLAEGGGDGFLEKWYSITGCWLNLMRGYCNAIRLMNDDDKAPYSALSAKTLSLGTTTEGDSYDYLVSRKALLSLKFLYKKRGTCQGIIEAIKLFTSWDAVCAEVGLKSECAKGSSSLSTWDGVGKLEGHTPELTALTTEILSVDGRARISDTESADWLDGIWAEGKLIGICGDVACIETNGSNYVETKAPLMVCDVVEALSLGDTEISVDAIGILRPGIPVQITGLEFTSGDPVAEIVDIVDVDPLTSTLTVAYGVLYTYRNYPKISVGKSIVRLVYEATLHVENADTVLVFNANWVENQWKGKTCMLADGSHTITTSDGNSITIHPAYAWPTSDQLVQICADSDPSGGYTVTNGAHTFLFDPKFPLALRGSLYDPHARLWQGAMPIDGVWGPNDLAMVVTSDVAVTLGKPKQVAGNTLTVDDFATPLVTNTLIGMFLNPNQNQAQLFEIISNTETTITVGSDISSFIPTIPTNYLNSSVFYYVLRLRDRNRFLRITDRLNNEFSHQDINPHVLFV